MVDEFRNSRILVVEDEESLAMGLEFNLVQEGYVVMRAADGQSALDLFSTQPFDLVILDVMLPFVDGFEVARQMRAATPQLPILMLTARKAAQDRITGLQTGVDDYLTKPFHLEELLLRVKGMLRRKAWYREAESPVESYQFGENEIHFGTLTCMSRGQTFPITPHEAEFLRYFITHKDRIISRKELLENVWRMHGSMETRTVDNFVVRLRKYFEPDPGQPVYFISVRGAGYKFTHDA
jgi:DNA-binding response OmpR family regulator